MYEVPPLPHSNPEGWWSGQDEFPTLLHNYGIGLWTRRKTVPTDVPGFLTQWEESRNAWHPPPIRSRPLAKQQLHLWLTVAMISSQLGRVADAKSGDGSGRKVRC